MVLISKECFVLNLVEFGPVVLEKKIFKFRQSIFRYFVIISFWERAWPFIWTNLNPLQPMMLCAKFGWNWPLLWFWRWKCEKFKPTLTMRTATTDNGQILIRKAHLSHGSGDLKISCRQGFILIFTVQYPFSLSCCHFHIHY